VTLPSRPQSESLEGETKSKLMCLRNKKAHCREQQKLKTCSLTMDCNFFSPSGVSEGAHTSEYYENET